VWDIGHSRAGFGGVAQMQGDGNFVTYDSDYPATPATFNTTTNGYNGAYLTVNDDGTFSIWSADGSTVLRTY